MGEVLTSMDFGLYDYESEAWRVLDAVYEAFTDDQKRSKAVEVLIVLYTEHKDRLSECCQTEVAAFIRSYIDFIK